MLCAGLIHGDLSEFNILAASDGPIIIDLPQAVDAAGNNHAAAMLGRDVANLRNFFGRFAPEILATNYGDEIWATYQSGTLTPDSPLTGTYLRDDKAVDLEGVVREIGDAEREEAARLMRMQA
jgi:RIO kinase 1